MSTTTNLTSLAPLENVTPASQTLARSPVLGVRGKAPGADPAKREVGVGWCGVAAAEAWLVVSNL